MCLLKLLLRWRLICLHRKAATCVELTLVLVALEVAFDMPPKMAATCAALVLAYAALEVAIAVPTLEGSYRC